MTEWEWAGAAFRLLLVVVIAWNQVRLMRENERLRSRLRDFEAISNYGLGPDTERSRAN